MIISMRDSVRFLNVEWTSPVLRRPWSSLRVASYEPLRWGRRLFSRSILLHPVVSALHILVSGGFFFVQRVRGGRDRALHSLLFFENWHACMYVLLTGHIF